MKQPLVKRDLAVPRSEILGAEQGFRVRERLSRSRGGLFGPHSNEVGLNDFLNIPIRAPLPTLRHPPRVIYRC
jgi:hypothetical protein